MQPSAVLSAEERLLAWPDSYYNESEPQLRREMLDLAIGKGLSPEERQDPRRAFPHPVSGVRPDKGGNDEGCLPDVLDFHPSCGE